MDRGFEQGWTLLKKNKSPEGDILETGNSNTFVWLHLKCSPPPGLCVKGLVPSEVV